MARLLLAGWLVVFPDPLTGWCQSPFETQIRPTPALESDEQLKRFHIPPEFEIQLFAAEPSLQKPMNMAFDSRGRLWVSGSVEYPYAAATGQGHDSIRILEDTDQDGRADRIRTFADGLNIPIGLYPFQDGVIVYSIPEILFLRDTDGDDRVDQREVLFSSLGNPRDTHGMQNAFRRGFDGWVYVCHGFNNESVITGKDGHSIRLNSGNTYRFRPDGSRVEQFTWGQVNPFGSTWTPWGDLINADCHSKPLSLLIRGGYYPSFGKPHDGLGFVPSMMEHSHGSTAIAGAVFIGDHRWPARYRGNLLAGNVMTSRVNRDLLRFSGSTVRAEETADFLSCDDPWFRPVDLQLGPDGALYIADFYNRIIGHYEVPLDHPERDRNRGRIWRIVPRDLDHQGSDLHSASPRELISALNSTSFTERQLATDQLSDRVGEAAIPGLLNCIRSEESRNPVIHSLWALHRINPELITDRMLNDLFNRDDAGLSVHLMRLIAEQSDWSVTREQLCWQGLMHPEGLVRRAAADAFGTHPGTESTRRLLDQLIKTPPNDALLSQTLRIALRNQLRSGTSLDHLVKQQLTTEEKATIADLCLSLHSEVAGRYLIGYLTTNESDPDRTRKIIAHTATCLPADQVKQLADLVQKRLADQPTLQIELIESIQAGLEQRNLSVPASLVEWSDQLAESLLTSLLSDEQQWTVVSGDSPWGLEPRHCEDGEKNVSFLSSLPGGEQARSVLRSKSFQLPGTLSFYLCGHRGFPQDPARDDNLVQLVLSSGDRVIRTVQPPRNDMARKVTWDLKEFEGQSARLELIDGIELNAYAWLAVARFEPSVVRIPTVTPDQTNQQAIAVARLIRTLSLVDRRQALKQLLLKERISGSARYEVCKTVLAMDPAPLRAALVEFVREPDLTVDLGNAIGRRIAGDVSKQSSDRAFLKFVMKTVPLAQQRQLADALTGSADGSQVLLDLIDEGAASARLLQQPGFTERIQIALGPEVQKRIQELTAGFPPLDHQRDRLIANRQADLAAHPGTGRNGRTVFRKHCSACHQIHGEGGLIAPQLDGIGTRGINRIVEDILDPNRNVDRAFHTTIAALTDGRVVSGLIRRQESGFLVLANIRGEEIRIRASEIEEQSRSAASIMPANFHELLSVDEFRDLAAYLATLKAAPPTKVSWNAIHVDPVFRSEGVAVGDVNRDGQLDLLAGEFWYEAPTWQRHEITAPGDYGDGARGYSNAFACFTDDVNLDGWIDYIVIGFPGAACHWFENPRGKAGHWPVHRIWHSACNETPLFTDLFGNGHRVLVMGWQPENEENAGQMAWFRPGADPTEPWKMHPISRSSEEGRAVPGTQRFAHGLGAGDLNGDKRPDVICTGGWWEQPKDPLSGQPWRFHAADLGPACANMQVVDVDQDGRNDIISSSAHGFGIWWHRQARNGVFQRSILFEDLVSQTHALASFDLNADGVLDLVSGKRFWAHGPDGDPGSDQPPVLYWFEAIPSANGTTSFIPRAIHHDSGIGTQFTIADLNGDKRPDVITANKKGVWIFQQTR